jgi:hypothetical protein
MSKEEIDTYKQLGKPTFSVHIRYKNSNYDFNFRKSNVILNLNYISNNWEFYLRNFKVKTNLPFDQKSGLGYVNFESIKNLESESEINLNFTAYGNLKVLFSWNEIRSLSEIEKIDGFSVLSIGNRSEIEINQDVYTEFDISPKYFEKDYKTTFGFVKHQIKLLFEAERPNITGRIAYNFIVNLDGSIEQLSLEKDLGFGIKEEISELKEEISELLKESGGHWSPGEKYGRKVRSKIEDYIIIKGTIKRL